MRGLAVLEPLEMEIVSDAQTMGKPFFSALLLTCSPQRAEAAVLQSIEAWNPDHPMDQALLLGAINASIDPRGEAPPLTTEAFETALSMLPLGLHGVLRLPSELRRCFVLRVLVGLSRRVCAGMLHMHPRDVDRYTCLALARLPALRARSTQVIGWNLLFRLGKTYYEQT